MIGVGPYQPCPCGSGKKYKFCCHASQRVAPGGARSHQGQDGGGIQGKKPVLVLTATEELFLPSRIVYRVFDRKELVKRFSSLRCMEFDPSHDRWTWNYEAEAKKLGLSAAYDRISAESGPLLLASCYLVKEDVLHVYVRSTLRLRKFLVFFDQHIPHACAKGEFLDEYNLVTTMNPRVAAARRIQPEDYFRDDSKLAHFDIDRIPEDPARARDALARQLVKDLQPLERHRLHAFYEDGEDHMVTACQLREILALKQRESKKPIQPLKVMEEVLRRNRSG